MEYSFNKSNGTGYTSSDKGSNSGGGFRTNNNYLDESIANNNKYGDYGNDKRRADSAANDANQIATADRAANQQLLRTKDISQFGANLAQQNQGLDFARSLEANDISQKFKAGESQKDRNQRAQEFADNQFMQRHQMNQGRADLEYNTQQGQKNTRLQEDAAQRLRGLELANASSLANVNQQTELAKQGSQVEQANLAAKAQVQAALFGSKPGYVGY